jgi:hypothetical protein
MKKKTKEIISIKHLFLSGYACNVPVYTLHQYLIYIFLEGSFTYQGDKVYQLLAHGRWFSPASSTTKTDRHDIAEILLRVVLNTKNQNQSTYQGTIQKLLNSVRYFFLVEVK